MKSFLFLIFSSILFASAQPPASGRISGKVVDATSGKPLEYSSLTIQNLKDTTIILGSLVDEKGNFEISAIPYSVYKLTVSFLGYKDYIIPALKVFPPDHVDVKLGTLKVNEDAKVLDEVEIKAEKSIMTLNAEKKVFNVDKNTLSAGGTAIDALKQVPTLNVDTDGNLENRGSTNLKIYINGRPSGITAGNTKAILEAIPANTIESIEVINNPSAKYEAEGDIGIINIILKKSANKGLNGNFTVGYATKYDFNTGVTLNFRNEKVSTSTNYSIRYNESFYGGNSQRYNFPNGISPYYLLSKDRTTSDNINNTLTNTTDWYIKEKNTWSFSTLLSNNLGFSNGKSQSDLTDSAAAFLTGFNRYTKDKSINYNAELTTSYRRTFKSNSHDLVLTGNYAYVNRGRNPDYTQLYFDINNTEYTQVPLIQSNTIKNKNHTAYFQADYTQPFEKVKGKFETGYRASYRNLLNDFYADSINHILNKTETDSSITNRFRYKELINAAYAIYGGNYKKFSYKVGMRFEYSLVNGKQYVQAITNKQRYFDYFPSASFSLKLPKNNDISISYSKRINRPQPEQLNPFGSREDVLNILTGNPNLKPAYSHNLEFTHTASFKKGVFLTSTIYYRYAQNMFTRYRLVDSTGLSIVTFDNLNKGQSAGGEFTVRAGIFKWWNIMANVNLFYNQMKGTVPPETTATSSHSFQYNFRIMNTFTFWENASLQFMVNYRSPFNYLQGKINHMVFASIGFKKDILKNKQGTIAINVNDVFHTMYFGVNTAGSTFSGSTKRYWESTIGTITFTYRFGKNDNKPTTPAKKKNNFEDSAGDVIGG